MILMRVLMSAMVRWLGSVMRVSNRMRRSCSLSWSRLSLLNLTSYWLKMGSSLKLMEKK